PSARRASKGASKGASARQQVLAAQQQLTSEDESSDADSVTRCLCGEQHHVGLMVQCDKCEVWQHCDCVGLIEKDIPDQYYCELCKPENHTFAKGHGRSKRVYNPNGPKDTVNKKSPKKRTTMNSRETSVPLSDAILHRGTAKSNSGDDNADSTASRTSKRRRKVDSQSKDDEDDELQDAKSQRSTSPASSRNSNPSRKRETSKSSSVDSTTSNGVKRSRSGSPIVPRSSPPSSSAAATAYETRTYESDNEASSPGSAGGPPSAGKKRRRTDKTPQSCRGSASANDEDAKVDSVDSLEDALFVKEELSDVEALLGADDDDLDYVNIKTGSILPEPAKEHVSPPSTKASGRSTSPAHSTGKRLSSGSRKNPTATQQSPSKPRDNNSLSHTPALHAPSTRQRSRTSTPQPADSLNAAAAAAGPSSHDRDRSRCSSPPARVRYPSSRMSFSEMDRRAKQILEYISRLQVEMADKKDELVGADADVEASGEATGAVGSIHVPVVVVEADGEGLVAHVKALNLNSSDDKDEKVIKESKASLSTLIPHIIETTDMEVDMVHPEVSQFENASSSSATIIPLDGLRPVSSSPVTANATATTPSSVDPNSILLQPSLSSSSTCSTISSTTTILSSDADVTDATPRGPSPAVATSDLTSIEMMDKLARELINFQRKFGGNHKDSRFAGSSTAPSHSVFATNGLSSVTTANATTPLSSPLSLLPHHHHNTRDRMRSCERSADPDRDVVESLLMMGADLGASGAGRRVAVR
ncbi:hypothetical protein BC938DRAFT_483022, partial [Jimgerdemannia flammicorona]